MSGLPPLPDGVTWNALHQRFHTRLKRAGLLTVPPRLGALRVAGVAAAQAAVIGLLAAGPHGVWHLALVALAGIVVMRSGLLAHDIGHRNVVHDGRLASMLGTFVMTVLGGQANGHWLAQHSGHHRRTQDALLDPDLDVTAFALTAALARRKSGLWALTTRAQAWLFWPSATLMAFSTRLGTLSWAARNVRREPAQALALALHFALWLGVPALAVGWRVALLDYAGMTFCLGLYMIGAFFWNHLGRVELPSDEPVPFFARCYLGSRSLEGGPVLTWILGGLNFHIEHHLAPSVPVRALPAARAELKAVLAEVGLTLPLWRWSAAMREVHRHVAAMASQLPLENRPAAHAGALAQR